MPGNSKASRRLLVEVAHIGHGQVVELVAEQREGRRPRLGLRHIADLDAPAGDSRRRMGREHAFEPAIDLRGGNAAVPDLIGAEDRLHQPVDALAGDAPRAARSATPRICAKQMMRLLLQLGEQALLVGDEVPFVQADHDGNVPRARSGRPSVRSCFSKGMVASSRTTTTSAKRMARSESCTRRASPASRRCGRACAFRRCRTASPAGRAIPIRPRWYRGVMPASGPVSRRSSPIILLTSVDLPALGRPMMVTRTGLLGSLYSSSDGADGGGHIGPFLVAIALVELFLFLRLVVDVRCASASRRSEVPSPCSAENGTGSPRPSE